MWRSARPAPSGAPHPSGGAQAIEQEHYDVHSYSQNNHSKWVARLAPDQRAERVEQVKMQPITTTNTHNAIKITLSGQNKCLSYVQYLHLR